MARFEGKAVIVTGSSGGIGRAAAIRFSREGAKVALADIKEGGNREYHVVGFGQRHSLLSLL